MLNYNEFKQAVVDPVLQKINLYSEEASELLIATMAHESQGGNYVIQNENGVFKGALGIYQMESVTYSDIWKNYIANKKNLLDTVLATCNFKEIPVAYEMVWNMQFSTIMARIFYLRINAPLPPAHDIEQIWEYYKLHWNTNAGKATRDEFMRDYVNFTGKGK